MNSDGKAPHTSLKHQKYDTRQDHGDEEEEKDEWRRLAASEAQAHGNGAVQHKERHP